MNIASIRAFGTKAGTGFLLAGALGLGGMGAAQAGITTTTTPFTATTTLQFANSGNLPYNSPQGISVSITGSTGTMGGTNLTIPGSSYSLTLSNLDSGTTQIGFDYFHFGNVSVQSILLSNGDTLNGPISLLSGNQFLGFTDTAPFTSATLAFSGNGSYYLDDFRLATTAPSSSVPEPSSLALLASSAVFTGAAAWRRRKAA